MAARTGHETPGRSVGEAGAQAGTRTGRMGEQPGAFATGSETEVLGGVSLEAGGFGLKS